VFATGVVVVGDHGDLGAFERPRVGLPPFLGAHWARRRAEALASEPVGVFLPFDDHDPVFGFHGLERLGEAVEDSGCLAEVPDVIAGTVGAALPKLSVCETHDLEEQDAVLVAVGICGDDRAERAVVVPGLLGEEVAEIEPELADDRLYGAAVAGVAFHERTAV
jgi:hypothetical protein